MFKSLHVRLVVAGWIAMAKMSVVCAETEELYAESGGHYWGYEVVGGDEETFEGARITGVYTDLDGCEEAILHGAVTFPSRLGKYNVVSIGDGFDDSFENVTSIVIPTGVKEICTSAFCALPELTSVSLPSTLITIGQDAFSGCGKLRTVTFPSSLTTIGSMAFSETALTSVTLSAKLETLGEGAFAYTQIITLNLPASLRNLEDDFSWMECLSKITVDADNTVFSSDNQGFLYDKNKTLLKAIPQTVTSVTVPSTVTGIDANFGPKINSLSVASGNVKYVINHDALFTKDGKTLVCVPRNIRSFSIPAGTETIRACGFRDCVDLADVTMPNGVKTINYNAFWGCVGLSRINLPSSISKIGSSAFRGCVSLSELNLPGSITEISGSLCSDCENLTELAIPSSVTKIGVGAFRGCNKLKTLYLPTGTVAEKGLLAQGSKRCTSSLECLTIPVLFSSKDGATFSDCDGLCEVYLLATGYGETARPNYSRYDPLWLLGNGLKNRVGSVTFYHRITRGNTQPSGNGWDYVYQQDWTPTYATVYFNANGGGIVEAQRDYPIGPMYGGMPPVYREGHFFDGWWTASSGGTRVHAYDRVTGGRTLYAHWTKANVKTTVTVSFNANGGTGTMPAQTFTVDVDDSLCVNRFARDGYRFQGWSSDPDDDWPEFEDGEMTSFSEDVTLYAIWRRAYSWPTNYRTNITPGVWNECAVIMEPGDGSGVARLYEGLPWGDYWAPECPYTRVGYKFAGWKFYSCCYYGEEFYTKYGLDDCGLLGIFQPGDALDVCGTSALVATWEADEEISGTHQSGGYTWKYVVEEGVLSLYDVSPAPSGTLTIPGAIAGMPVRRIWTIGCCSPYVGTMNFANVTGFVLPSTLERLWRKEFEKSKWYAAQSGVRTLGEWAIGVPNGNATTRTLTVPAGVKKIAAGFAALTTADGCYYEKLVLPDSVVRICNEAFWLQKSLVNVHIPSSVNVLEAGAFGYVPGPFYFHGDKPTTDGYDLFSGLNTSEPTVYFRSGTSGWIDGECWAGAIVRRWPTVTVAFDANGGSVSPLSKSYEAQLAYGTLPTPTKSGSTFAGWYTSSSGGSQVTKDSIVPNSATTLYARWNTQTYTITFNANGGSCTESSRTREHGATYGNLPPPTRTGYSFIGWFTSATGGSQVSPAMTVTADATLYAHWSAHSYRIMYDANGGTGTMAFTWHLYDEESFLSTCSFAKRGCRFVGWATSPAGDAVYSDRQRVKNLTAENNVSVTLFAIWAPAGVRIVSFRQRYPWNGFVDIEVEVDGDAGADYLATIQAMDMERVLLPVKTIGLKTPKSEGNPVVLKDGTNHLVWNAAVDLGDGYSCDNVRVRAILVAEENK